MHFAEKKRENKWEAKNPTDLSLNGTKVGSLLYVASMVNGVPGTYSMVLQVILAQCLMKLLNM